ncbi:MAG: S9 family peptidase, partial [Planctomycetes bacterium]|nr:S9 family peptidase [Planctomycetota bacterium]
MRRTRVSALLAVLALGSGLAIAPPGSGADPAAGPETITVTKWLALDPPDRGARRPFNPGAFFLRYLLDREAPPPVEGEGVTGTQGGKAWRAVTAKEDGTVEDASGAYFHAEVERSAGEPATVFLATLSGASALYVNGAGFIGDVYRGGYGPVPVALAPGRNRLFVIGPRGPWRLTLTAVPEGKPFLLRPEDATLPDFVEGGLAEGDVGFRVVCASERWPDEAEWDHPVVDKPFIFSYGSPSAWWPPPPLGVRKYANRITSSVLKPEVGPLEFQVRLGPDGPPTGFRIEVRRAREARRVTYVSDIDGAAQYFGFLPPAAGYHEISTLLSLHGAGVEALGQARSYSPRPDFRVVAPTNRRPFGFDWQDQGRTDALEALWTAVGIFEADPTRTFLTGHSMGGHGAWHLAANDPDRFAAVAPSAGWCSFDTYAGGPRPRGPLAVWWDGCDGGSRTEDLVSNLAQLPLFIVHGKADDNVPFPEAEGMLRRLTEAGAKPGTLFVDGAGHWWDGDAAPGADCVDHPEIFTFFRGTPTPVEP